MKKTLLLLASAALLFAGCAKEQIAASVDDGESVEVTVSAQLQNAEQTKASWDNDGNGAKVDHWIMEVYDAQGVLFDRQEKTDQSGLTNSFTVVLVKNQSYKFAFWADTKDSYDTADLRAVKTVSTVAGLDSRDAFFAEVDYTSSKSETITAKLYRPFAQINIVTLDLKKIWDQMTAAGTTGDYAKFIPTDLKLTGETYNQFNVLTGKVSDVKTSTLSLASCYANYSAHAAKTTIFMDYLFASTDKELKDLAFSFISNGVEIAYDFTNIPLQRNYRTNIKGNLLSNDATWEVDIIPDWIGENDVDYVAAGSIEAANKALKDGVTNIQIENPEDVDTHVIFPEEVEGKDINITITGAAGKTIYFENEAVTKAVETTDGPAKLTIVTDVQNLNVNCPNTALAINKMAGESDFPVVKAKSLSITGVEGAVLKTGANGKSLSCESSLKNVEIKTDSANQGTDGALNVNKSSSFENATFTGAAKYVLVLGGQDTQMDVTNCNFANKGKGRGIMVWGGSPAININGCTFDNTYPFNVDAGTPVFTVTNSTLNGWTSYTTTATASFENCSFGKSTSEYAYCRPYSSTKFTQCDFSSDFKLDFGENGITLTLEKCTVGETNPVTKAILDTTSPRTGNLVILNNAAEKALSEATEGDTVTLTAEDAAKDVNIPANLPARVTIASDITSKSTVSKFEIPAGAKIENLTIKNFEPTLQAGASNSFVHVPADASFSMTVKDVKAAGDGVKNNWNTLVRVESCDNASLASEIVIDGVELDGAKYLVYSPGGSRAISLTIKNCTIKNLTSWMAMANGSQFQNVTIDNCTIENCSGIVKLVMNSFIFTNNTLVGDNKEDHTASKKCIDYRGSNPTMTVSGNTSNGVNCDDAILAKTF